MDKSKEKNITTGNEKMVTRVSIMMRIMTKAIPINDFVMKGNEVIIHDLDNDKMVHIGVENFFIELGGLVDYMMIHYSEENNVFECGSLAICLEKILKNTECDREEYNIFKEETLKKWNRRKDKEDKYNFIASICGIIDQDKMSKESEEELNQYTVTQRISKLIFYMDTKDKVNIIKDFMSKDDFEEGKYEYLSYIIRHEDLLKALLKMEYITREDIIKEIEQTEIYANIKEFGRAYLIKYLDVEHVLKGYKEGIVDKKEFAKVDFKELILRGISCLTKDELMEAIVRVKKDNRKDSKNVDVQEILWELYEKDYFSTDDINKLMYYRLIGIDSLVKQYKEERARKIKAELSGYSVTDGKLMQVLTPERILKVAQSNDSNKLVTDFVKSELKNIYESNGANWSEALIREKEEAAKDSKNKPDYLSLYYNGLVELSDFKNNEITAGDIKELYVNTQNSKAIVDAYECGILEAEDVYTMLGENTSRLCSLIKEDGLNSNILPEFHSAYEILKMYSEDKISSENVANLKDSLDVEEIKKLYVTKKIALDILDDLGTIGLISDDKIEEIKAAYDIKADYEKLLEKGRVIGFFGEQEYIPKEKTGVTRVSRGSRKVIKDKIGKELRASLFKMLGAEDVVLPIEGDIWERGEGNELYTILDKKVAYIEPKNGRELTFAMPLRLILEYATGEDDIISKVSKKKDLASYPFVKAYKHSAQWGLKTVEAAAEIDGIFGKTKPTKDAKFKEIINEISNSYKQASKEEKEVQ